MYRIFKIRFIGPRPRGSGDNKSIGGGKTNPSTKSIRWGNESPTYSSSEKKISGASSRGAWWRGAASSRGARWRGALARWATGETQDEEREVNKQIHIKNPDHNKSSSAVQQIHIRNPDQNKSSSAGTRIMKEQTNKSPKKSGSDRTRRIRELTGRPDDGLQRARGAGAAPAIRDRQGDLKQHINQCWANFRGLTWAARTRASPQPLARARSSHPRAEARF